MQTQKIHTGIKAKASLDENLSVIRETVKVHGYKNVLARLEEMKAYPWVHHNNYGSCDCLACYLIRQLEWDRIIAKPVNQSYEDRITTLLEKYKPGYIGGIW